MDDRLNLIDFHHNIVLLRFSHLKPMLFLFLVSVFHYILRQTLFKFGGGLDLRGFVVCFTFSWQHVSCGRLPRY